MKFVLKKYIDTLKTSIYYYPSIYSSSFSPESIQQTTLPPYTPHAPPSPVSTQTEEPYDDTTKNTVCL
jgi:hypothetical protein